MNRRVPTEASRGGAQEAPRPLTAWAHLAVLWSFAVAKPLFDILADSPEFFVARENTSGDIVLLALAVTLVPPTLLLAFELLLGRVPKARRLLHLAFVALLGGAIAIQVLKDLTSSPNALLIPVALALGAAGAVAYERGRVVRTALTVLSPLPLLFVIVFLLISPVSELVLPGGTESAEAGLAGAKRVPIVMVVFDELSGHSLMDARGRVDATRYPNFARLANDATWYPNTTTVADNTTRAVPAILTGERANKDDLPTSVDHPDSLFSLLGDRYAFNVEEPITSLCSEVLCGQTKRDPAGERLRELTSDLSVVLLHRFLPNSLRDELPAVDQAFSDFRRTADSDDALARAFASSAGERREAFRRFLQAIRRRPDTPTLDFAHLELPHSPWEYLPSGQRYVIAERGATDGVWTKERRLVVQAQQRYLLQLAYVDRLVGRLLNRLESTGLYDRALLVVTADHGVAFRPGENRRAVSTSAFAQIAGVPLFVKAPGQRRGRTDASPARTIDILPTIAEQLGSELSWDADGHSLSAPAAGDPRSLSVFGVLHSVDDFPVSEFRRLQNLVLARDTRLLGFGDHGRGVFAPGADAGLIGRAVGALPSAPPLAARAELDSPGTHISVDAETAVLPAFVAGRILGDLPPRQLLAVSVNGRIAALTRSFVVGDSSSFESIVDPEALRPGANEIRLFAVRGGADPSLAALGQRRSESYRLATRDGRLWIIGSSGSRVRVVPGAVGGFVERVERSRAELRVGGWSASAGRGAARRVLLFLGDRYLAATRPSETRRDVAEELGRRALVSGFSFGVQLDNAPDRRRVRAFGLVGERASELPRAKGG